VNLKGTPVSPGIAIGAALVMDREVVPVFRLLLPPEAIAAEVQRFERAVAASRTQLLAIKERLAREVGAPHAYIFDAQLLMLDDPMLLDRVVSVIQEEHVNAEWALRTVAAQLHALFDGLSDAYLKECSSDVDDVLGRLLLNLAGVADAPSLRRLPSPAILVASDLTPSEAAELDWERVLGVAVDAGSRTHHTAILAKSLGIPAVVSLQDATHRVPPGALLVLDGSRGQLVVEPSAPTLEVYRTAQERERLEERRLQETRGLASITRDGVSVRLEANAEFPEEASTARLYGAAGIGLFRSEYLLARGRNWPTEEQQLEVYRHLLEQMHPHPVTVRTWDVGLEDLAPGGPTSANPALGERALRLLRRDPEPFRIQLRALLRAATRGPLRIMLPFVSGPADLRSALGLLEEARTSLAKDGLEFRSDVPVGLILEIPGAALTADFLARDVDFLSIGTNDLVQYLLAVDRAEPRVAALYQPLHPAVLRTIVHIVEACGARGLPLSVCGEMAAEPLAALLLVGLGVRELSMSPAAVPRVKAALRSASAARAVEVARACLALSAPEEIEAALRRELGSDVPAAALKE
jgi:phosphotransferase system enzyme I (PtsI)